MTPVRRILILYTGDGVPGDLGALADGLAGQGAAVNLRSCDSDYDAELDAIAAADTVMYWD